MTILPPITELAQPWTCAPAANDDRMSDQPPSQRSEVKVVTVEANMKTVATEIKAETDRLRADFSRWTLQTVLAIVTTMVVCMGGLFWTMSTGFRELRDRPAAAPTIVYVPLPTAAATAPAPSASR